MNHQSTPDIFQHDKCLVADENRRPSSQLFSKVRLVCVKININHTDHSCSQFWIMHTTWCIIRPNIPSPNNLAKFLHLTAKLWYKNKKTPGNEILTNWKLLLLSQVIESAFFWIVFFSNCDNSFFPLRAVLRWSILDTLEDGRKVM